MGPYPIFSCGDWGALAEDLRELAGELVSVSLVADPFGDWSLETLEHCFPDVLLRFKDHFVVELGPDPMRRVQQNHRRNAARAERIGLVTEVVTHDRLLPRAVELASQIAEVPAPIMAGLKEIYVTGSAAVTGPALAAEQDIAGAQELDRDGLGARYAEITERNRRQIRPQS